MHGAEDLEELLLGIGLGASAWAACAALVAAVEAAGSDDPALVAAQLQNMSLNSPFGTVSFDKNGQSSNPMSVVQFAATGSLPRIVSTSNQSLNWDC